MKNFGLRKLVIVLMVSVPSWPAFAGGTAEMVHGDGGASETVTMEFRDANTARFNTDQDSYVILREGNVYAVSQQGSGQPTVMDMSQLMGAMGKLGLAQKPPSTGAEDVANVAEFKDTGRSETVAGIKGKVYLITYQDGSGNTRTDEIVLSNDKRVREMWQAWKNFALAMGGAGAGAVNTQGAKDFMARVDGQQMGMLRFGTQARVASLSSKTPSNSRFELPGPVTQMPDFGSFGAAASGNASAESEKGSGNPFAAIFGGKAERQTERQENRAEDRLDQETDKATDKFMDKALDKLFGK